MVARLLNKLHVRYGTLEIFYGRYGDLLINNIKSPLTIVIWHSDALPYTTTASTDQALNHIMALLPNLNPREDAGGLRWEYVLRIPVCR